jgi:hypothetical protein
MQPSLRPIIRRAERLPLHAFLSENGFDLTAAEAARLLAAAETDPTRGASPLLLFDGSLRLLNRGTLHLVRDRRALCGCPEAHGRTTDPGGLDSSDWWRLCRRCWRRAEAAGLVEYGV